MRFIFLGKRVGVQGGPDKYLEWGFAYLVGDNKCSESYQRTRLKDNALTLIIWFFSDQGICFDNPTRVAENRDSLFRAVVP